MTWYVASIIMSIRKTETRQEEIPVYENFILLEAVSSEGALQKAISLGREEESYNKEMTLDAEPARLVFEGVRKLINISNSEPLSLDQDSPASGTELTYSEYVLDNDDQVKLLATGKEVSVRYIS